MSSARAKASPTPSKSSSHSKSSNCDDDEDSEVVDKILGLLCYRIYVMFRFICCFPVASKLYSRSSKISQSRSQSSHQIHTASSVRIIEAGDSPPPQQRSPKSLQKKILEDLTKMDSRPSLKLSRKGILKDSNYANSKFKISQDIPSSVNKKKKFPFMKLKDFKLKMKEKEVFHHDQKEMVVTYHKDDPNFRSDSTVHTEFGDWRNSLKWSKGSRRPVNFYNDIFEGCPECV